VVDFFDIRIFQLFLFNNTIGTYIFNVADLAVSVGVIILLLSLRKSAEQSLAVEESNIAAENRE
jgi:lipoprotein signal peptidase